MCDHSLPARHGSKSRPVEVAQAEGADQQIVRNIPQGTAAFVKGGRIYVVMGREIVVVGQDGCTVFRTEIIGKTGVLMSVQDITCFQCGGGFCGVMNGKTMVGHGFRITGVETAE